MIDATVLPPLTPPQYLRSLAAFLESNEPDAWAWFASELTGMEYAEKIRLEILKSTFRIAADSSPQLYTIAESVKQRLGVQTDATFYQMQQTVDSGLNAALFYIPNEIHIAFHGPVLDRLGEDELAALIGHEIGHFILLERWDRRYRIVEELMVAMLNDPQSSAVHEQTFKLMRLYREIFSDRVSFAACGGMLEATVGALVKIQTGADLPASDYVRQTEEIFSKDDASTRELSHPESFIRVRALQLWSANDPDLEAKTSRMIEGDLSFKTMDLLGQQKMSAFTRQLMDAVLSEQWMRSDSVMAHANLFFEDYSPPDSRPDIAALKQLIKGKDSNMGRYFSYLLLDFASCDQDIEEPALALALTTAKELGIDEHLEKDACKELRINKRQFEKLKADAQKLIEGARKQQEGSQ